MRILSEYSQIPDKRRGGGGGVQLPYFYLHERKGGGGCIKRLYLGRAYAGERFDIELGGVGLIRVEEGGLKVNNQGFIELGKMSREQVVAIADDCGIEVREYR